MRGSDAIGQNWPPAREAEAKRKVNTMAKATKKNATPKADPKAAEAPKATRKGRGAQYTPESVITIVAGDGARRVVKSLACDRALTAMRANPVVGKYVAAFGTACEKQPLPGRSGQPGHVQAAAILRFLEREGAVTVASK
jgi:hypothetical protein